MVDEEKMKKDWWENMISKLEVYNLSNNEQQVIKADFDSKEANLYRKM
jgi:hypothetical protein